MKTCVSSYSFSSFMSKNQKTQAQLIPIAKEMGFDAIEFTDLAVPDGMSEKEYGSFIRSECEKYSIAVAAYTVGADFLKCRDFDEEIERICSKIDTAKAMGVSLLRHDATVGYRDERKKYCSFESVLPTLAHGCRAVTEYAEKAGIQTMVENHGFFCQDSDRVERLIGMVNNPNFGWLVDIGNFLCADENPVSAVGKAASHAKHVHVKDFHVKSGSEFDPGRGFFTSRGGNYLRGAMLGQGNVPVYQCLKIIESSGYDGYVSIEFEGIEDNIPAIETGLENLKKMLAAL